jgi:hypothetical protein
MSVEINERAQRVTHLTADRDAMIRSRQADAPLNGNGAVKVKKAKNMRIIPPLEKA